MAEKDSSPASGTTPPNSTPDRSPRESMSKEDAAALKIAAASGIVDLVCTLEATGDLESLNKHSLFNALSSALDLLDEARSDITGVTS